MENVYTVLADKSTISFKHVLFCCNFIAKNALKVEDPKFMNQWNYAITLLYHLSSF